MKILYFDVDGTVVRSDGNEPKEKLANGNFEAAVRRAGFNRLVCVGNFSRIARFMKEMRPDYDALGVLFCLCRGTFADEQWFRSVTGFVIDPANRFKHVELRADWWYLDDLAAEYVHAANHGNLLRSEAGRRIFSPAPTGDGQDVLNWLGTIAAPQDDAQNLEFHRVT